MKIFTQKKDFAEFLNSAPTTITNWEKTTGINLSADPIEMLKFLRTNPEAYADKIEILTQYLLEIYDEIRSSGVINREDPLGYWADYFGISDSTLDDIKQAPLKLKQFQESIEKHLKNEVTKKELVPYDTINDLLQFIETTTVEVNREFISRFQAEGVSYDRASDLLDERSRVWDDRINTYLEDL